MKRQYIFIVLIVIMLYSIYIIWDYKYSEYKINSSIEYIRKINNEIKLKIEEAKEIITYKNSKAYKNKVIKQEQWLKNKWEKVLFLTTEKKYNTFTKESIEEAKSIGTEKKIEKNINPEKIREKWINIIFNKQK